MYESPIEVYYKEFRTKVENDIVKAIQEYGISVNKEELIEALQYDRGQYEKGYRDGLLHRADEWISVEERLPEDNERVLCFIPDWVESNLGAVIVQFGWCCKRRNMIISHWMPLPEPPKGD